MSDRKLFGTLTNDPPSLEDSLRALAKRCAEPPPKDAGLFMQDIVCICGCWFRVHDVLNATCPKCGAHGMDVQFAIQGNP